MVALRIGRLVLAGCVQGLSLEFRMTRREKEWLVGNSLDTDFGAATKP